jgi:hypothetical protein
MSNVIEFPVSDEDFNHTAYHDYKGDVGVTLKANKDLIVTRLNVEEFEVSYHGGSFVIDRSALAEFMHVCIKFIDSEDRYLPSGKFVACDY